MKYLGEQYVIAGLTDNILESFNNSEKVKELQFSKASVTDENMTEDEINEIRHGKIAWIKSPDLKELFLNTAQGINVVAKWHLNITSISDIQYGIYDVGDYYNWHIDQFTGPNEGDVRKISMTCFLNEDYGGGELDIELNKPDCKDGRYLSFKEKSGSIIFFHSDAWHRVRPVTSGIRKSLVAWFSGPAYV